MKSFEVEYEHNGAAKTVVVIGASIVQALRKMRKGKPQLRIKRFKRI